MTDTKIRCQRCNSELTAEEAAKPTCPKCGIALAARQDVTVKVSMPPLFGGTM